jgi:hypothetical protein
VICTECLGDKTITYYVSDPENCVNCSYGDCDYGHPRERPCDRCDAQGVVPDEGTVVHNGREYTECQTCDSLHPLNGSGVYTCHNIISDWGE